MSDSDFSDAGVAKLSTRPKTFRVNRRVCGGTWSCPKEMDENPIRDFSDIIKVLESKGECQWLISVEDHESGKKHFHAWWKYKKTVDVRGRDKWFCKGVEPEIIKPGRGWQKYVSKGNDFVANFPWRKPVKLIDPNYGWEKDILEIIKEEPDDRTIYWYWEPDGCAGKTQFCKYLIVKHNACLVHGKGNDVRNGVKNWAETNKGCTPELVIYPIPRCFGMEYLSYESLENIKDMCFYSGKYEGGTVVGNAPHLFVFANCEPDYEKMSGDRWKVIDISEG